MGYEWVQHSLSVSISTAALNKVKLTNFFVQNVHFLNELASCDGVSITHVLVASKLMPDPVAEMK